MSALTCCPHLNEAESQKYWGRPSGLLPSLGLQISLEFDVLWSCSLYIFSWNWCGNWCLSVGMPLHNVCFPDQSGNLKSVVVTRHSAFALPSMTRASSNISQMTSGSGQPFPSSSIEAYRIGLATVIKGPSAQQGHCQRQTPPRSSENCGIFWFSPSCLPPWWVPA